MQPKSKSPIRWFTVIVIAAMVMLMVFASRREQAASQSRRQLEQERQKADIEKFTRNRDALPRAEYAAPEPEDLALRQLRKVRGKRYRASMPFENLPADATEVATMSHEVLDMPGLPMEQSDLIVAGVITSANGYVTENKSAAYSEYAIKITEVFKGNTKLVGSQITAERTGARVVLPSGRTILIWDTYSGTPEISHRYVMFLKYSAEGEDYLIVTAYDLRNGKVMSIDRLPQCAFFDGNEEIAFLDLVRSSIK